MVFPIFKVVLSVLLKPFIKIWVFNMIALIFLIGLFISVYRVGIKIAQGIWAILIKLWDVIKSLIKALGKIGDVGGEATDFVSRTIKAVGGALGFHEGGIVRQQDLLRGPGMRPDEGLILAKAGERVQTPEQQQQDRSIIINVSAISPRESANEIRNVIQELQVQGLLGT